MDRGRVLLSEAPAWERGRAPVPASMSGVVPGRTHEPEVMPVLTRTGPEPIAAGRIAGPTPMRGDLPAARPGS